jgi:hypothetical protein
MKKNFWGLISPAVVFLAAVLAGCDGTGGTKETYVVEVSPRAITLVKGAAQQFSAVLTKDGEAVTDATVFYAWTSAPAGGQPKELGTTTTLDLTVPAEETAASITVTTVINYRGASYTGAARITVVAADDAVAAFRAITAELGDDAFVAALKAVPGINPKYFATTGFKSSVLQAKPALAETCATATEGNVAALGAAINGILSKKVTEQVLALFNDQGQAAIQDSLTRSNFELFQLRALWTVYSGLSSTEKDTITAKLVAGRPYGDLPRAAQILRTAIEEAAGRNPGVPVPTM